MRKPAREQGRNLQRVVRIALPNGRASAFQAPVSFLIFRYSAYNSLTNCYERKGKSCGWAGVLG